MSRHSAKMLHDLITDNRELLLEKSAHLSALSRAHTTAQIASLGHISVFLDQLIDTLRAEHGRDNAPTMMRGKTHGPSPAVKMSYSAATHGRELRESHLTIAEVVRNYGSLCQAITGYAMETNAPIDVAEFKTLNWCLDEGIAQAVVAFTTPAPPDVNALNAARLKQDSRLDELALMTYHIERISNAVSAMRSGKVGLDGATAAMLDQSLNGLRKLVAQGVDQQF